jgi:hypothetical protein
MRYVPFRLCVQFGNYELDRIFSYVDLTAIECASMSGRRILNLVEVLNDATKHIRKDFAACCGDAHASISIPGHEYRRTHLTQS